MSLLSIEIFIIKLFQLYQPSWLTSIMLFISLISSIGSYFIIVPIVALFFSFKNYKTEAFFSIFINLGNILNPIIKNIAGRSRPNSGLIKILEEKTSMSFPSGHAMGAIIFYGFLIYLIWKLPFKHKKIIIPLLLLFILLVGISRIYLGAHWPTDVLAGYVIGFIWLICGIFIYSKFRNKIRELLTTPTSGGPVNIEDCHEKRPNNWGTMCGGSRAAVAAYLNDDAKLDRVAQVFKGYLGDRSSYVSFSYGDLSWQCNPSQPVGINPIGCIKEGHSIDGVMPDDQRRCGSFSWPPCNTGYAWEGQQGILFEAIILSRQGYDVWNWEDRAILRAHAWKVNVGNNQAGGDDTWQPWVVNYYYNTNFPAPSPSNHGKNIGWTDWTHQGNAQPLQSCSQQNGLCCGAAFTCSGNAIPSSDCNTICCLGSCQTPPQDTTPPTVSVNHNPTTNIQTTTSVNIIATATDQSGISNIEIFVDGSSRRTCTSYPCSYSSTYNAGSHSYYATARDIPGNQGRDPLTGSKSFNVISGTCTTGQWQNQGCGEGSCTSSQMYQTRTVNPNGCAVTDQCVSDPSCTTS